MTPYYSEAGITIYHGRCEDVIPSLNAIDLVVTSPPYNLGWATGASHHSTVRMGHSGSKWTGAALSDGYEDHDDRMPSEEYEAWQRTVLAALWETLSDEGAIFYNHKPRVSDKNLWTPLVLNPGLPLRQIIIWARAGGINYAASHYVPTHEWVLVFARPGWKLRDQSASGVGDVWRIPQAAAPEHPAPFPVGLPARAIETTAPDLVLDPFMGSGTTLVAAKAAGVKSIGIEQSERYCEIAAARLSQEALNFGGVA